MASVLDVIARVLKLIDAYKVLIDQVSALKAENLDLKEKLTVALQNDAADAEAIAAAKADLEATKAEFEAYKASQPEIVQQAEEIKSAFEGVADKLPADV